MKTKLLSLFLALAANVGTIFAQVKIGDLYYTLTDASGYYYATVVRRPSYGTYAGDTISIPESVTYNSKKYSVQYIGDNAFESLSNLKKIIIPKTIYSIGDCAFRGCSGLSSVEIPINGSLSKIGFQAFARCCSLQSIIIPNRVTSIKDGTFSGCFSLTSITLSDELNDIGYQAFADCIGLTTIDIPNSVDSINSGAFVGCTNFPEIDNIRYAGPFVIEAVDTTLSSYNIIAGTKWMGSEAFMKCENLQAVTIPATLRNIGAGAFLGLHNLTSINLPAKLRYIDENAFRECSGLTAIDIPDSVRSIDDYAFEGCSNLSRVRIGDGVERIGYLTFYNCPNISSLYIGKSVADMSSQSGFKYCDQLTKVEINSTEITSGRYLNELFGDQVTQYIIGDSVTSIGDLAFYECSELKSINIGNNVAEIGGFAFKNCSNLQSVSFGNKAVYVQGCAFQGCDKIDSIKICQLSSWCEMLFENDEATPFHYDKSNNIYLNGELITDIIIPEGTSKIGDYVFLGCTSLTSVRIPNSVTSVGKLAFWNDSNITTIKIPNNVTTIGEAAFTGCNSMKSVDFGSGVTLIQEAAFYGCNNIESVTCRAITPPDVESDVFSIDCSKTPLYVPDQSIDEYKYAYIWEEFNPILPLSLKPQEEAIEEISSSPQGGDRGRLILRNGQIFILRGDKTYTLTGQEVK